MNETITKPKCYIAGKIGALPEEVYVKNFLQAAYEVAALGFHPINPCEINHSHDRTWLSFMRADLAELLKCDAVYAQSNWKDSPGATIEVCLALSLGIEVHYQQPA